jgi:hypothetical protein
LRSVAAQTGLALENSRLTEAIVSETAQRERLNREVEIAREVQERLFPQELPPVKGLDYFGACRPALGVGGDYYDFLELQGGKFGIAIGDVSGKGIGASLMMASLQASLRGQALHAKDDLAELMSRVNKLVYEASTTNRYATFFYAQFEPATRKLVYVNAGHNPPFVIRRREDDFEVLRLEEGGAVVGCRDATLDAGFLPAGRNRAANRRSAGRLHGRHLGGDEPAGRRMGRRRNAQSHQVALRFKGGGNDRVSRRMRRRICRRRQTARRYDRHYRPGNLKQDLNLWKTP